MAKKVSTNNIGDWGGKWASVLKNEIILSEDVIPTGSIGLDSALRSGGIPYGSLVRLWGPGNSGKTSISQRMASYVMSQGQKVVWIDAETSLNPKIALANGLDISDETHFKIWRYDPDEKERPLNVENALTAIYEFIENDVRLIIIDSLDSLLPSKQIESEPGAGSFGIRAAILSIELPKIKGYAVARGCTIVFVQQIRDVIGSVSFGPTTHVSGGHAMTHYTTHEIQLQNIKKSRIGESDVFQQRIKATVLRNKSSGNFVSAEFSLRTDVGIDWVGDLIEYGELYGLVSKGGVWYTFNTLTMADGSEAKFQGQEATRAWLYANIDKAIYLDGEIRNKAFGK